MRRKEIEIRSQKTEIRNEGGSRRKRKRRQGKRRRGRNGDEG